FDQVIAVGQGFGKVVAGVDEKNALRRADARNDVQEIRRGGGKRRGNEYAGRIEIVVQARDARGKIQRRVGGVQRFQALGGQAGAVVAGAGDQGGFAHGSRQQVRGGKDNAG